MTTPKGKNTERLIQKATAHYQTLLTGAMRGPIKVPEWDTEIYWKTTSTMAQEARVIELTNQGKTTEALVMQLIIKALDADGKNLFDAGDKLALMNSVDPAVILRVVTSMKDDIMSEESDSGK